MKKDYQKPQTRVIELDAKTVVLQGSNYVPNGGPDEGAGAKGVFDSWDLTDW